MSIISYAAYEIPLISVNETDCQCNQITNFYQMFTQNALICTDFGSNQFDFGNK